jgi:hypothetical protein
MKLPSNALARALQFMASAGVAACLVGCGSDATGPPPISAEQRQAIKQNLTHLGARVTSDDLYGLYLSLRNTHVQVRDVGGSIEGAARTLQDVQDFWRVNEAVAKGFLRAGELATFQKWLKQATTRTSPDASRTEFSQYQLTLSKAPLRVIYSQRAAAEH